MHRLLVVLMIAGCGNDAPLGPDADPGAPPYTWEAETAAAPVAIFGAWATGEGDVFAVGDDVYHSAGAGAWTVHDPRAARAIAGRTTTDIFAVGESGTIAHYDGIGWLAVSPPTSSLLSSVWVGTGEAIAVGNLGTVVRTTGGAWAPETTGAGTGDLLGVAAAGTDVFVVGAGGVVLRRTAGVWTVEISNTTAFLSGVAAIDDADVWVVGGDLVGSQTMLHFDGDDWTPDAHPGETLYAVYAADTDDIYAVGRAGTIVHYDGETWRDEDSGTDADLYAITGAGDDVWIVGADGTTLRRVPR